MSLFYFDAGILFCSFVLDIILIKEIRKYQRWIKKLRKEYAKWSM